MEEHAPPPPTRSRRISLLHLFLLIAVAAIGVATWNIRQQTLKVEAQLPGLRSAARELIIADPMHFAAVNRHPTWWNERIWEVYLPPGNNYRAAIAQGVMDEQELIAATETVSIAAGRHVIKAEIDSSVDQRVFTLFIDGQERLRSSMAVEPIKPTASSSSSGGSTIGDSTSQPTDEPLMLFRERYFQHSSGPVTWSSNTPAPGYLFWIEAAE